MCSAKCGAKVEERRRLLDGSGGDSVRFIDEQSAGDRVCKLRTQCKRLEYSAPSVSRSIRRGKAESCRDFERAGKSRDAGAPPGLPHRYGTF